MTNTSLLIECIKESGLKKGYIAGQLGLSIYGLSLKCNNKSEFKAKEIETLCTLLDIDVEKRMAIFFAK